MSQFTKVSKNNTAITEEGGYTMVILHNTPVVKFNEDEIILNNGGWITSTTATRMTQVARQFELDFGISRKNGEMFVHYRDEKKAFNPTVTLSRK